MDGVGSKGLKTKLIVNYLPQNMSDSQFESFFSSIGPVTSHRIMRDKTTSYSFGYGFIDYEQPEHAVAAIEKLNGYKIENKTLRVAYSKPPGSTKNINLYVSGLAPSVDEKKLKEIFSHHGEIVNTKILREKDNSSKGVGFVLFKEKSSADAALRVLQGYGDGYGTNLQIKYAKDSSEQQKSHPKYHEFIQSKYQESHSALHQPYVYGMVPQYNQMQNQPGGYMDMNIGASYGGGYTTIDYSGAEMGGMGAQKSMRGRGGGTRYNPIARPTQVGLGMSMDSVEQNVVVLFVYNIGPNATESDLYGLFSRYGRITKVNVIEGKGYGFVHMPIPMEASEAVKALNGMFYNGKTLQVSVKAKK